MPEVKTEPLEAVCIQDKELFFKQAIPGSFRIKYVEQDQPHKSGWRFKSFCPCGCGSYSDLLIGRNEKPKDGPSWIWNGSSIKPDLKPSINHVGHWHGWLNDGIWVSC